MMFDGTYCSNPNEPANGVLGTYGWLTTLNPGEYIGKYGGDAPYVGGFQFFLCLKEDGLLYCYGADVTGTMTIYTVGNVGGDVDGVFDVTFEAMSTSAPSYGSPLTVIGGFRLLRVSDELFLPGS